MVKQATADGIKMIIESNPTKEIIALNAIKSLETLGDGKATKLIIPTEIASIASLATILKEFTSNEKDESNKSNE